MTDFKARRGRHRYWGSGCLGQRKGRWAGQYTVKWPDGRKVTRSVCADTEGECEKRLAEMITAIKTELAAEKERLKTENQVS